MSSKWFDAELMFLKYFYDNTIKINWRYKIFLSLNVVVILAPGRVFSSVKCVQFPLTFTAWNLRKEICPSELISFIFEIDLIKKQISNVSQIVNHFASKENCSKICTCPVYLISFHFTCLRSLLQWNWKMSTVKAIGTLYILWPMKNDVRFRYVP